MPFFSNTNGNAKGNVNPRLSVALIFPPAKVPITINSPFCFSSHSINVRLDIMFAVLYTSIGFKLSASPIALPLSV